MIDTEVKELLQTDAFEKYHDGMVFYAFQYLGNQKDSEDIVQEAFVKFLEAESLVFDSDKALKTYLYRMVRNACLNKLGRKDALRYRIDVINEEVREESHVTYDEKVLDEIREEISKLAPRTQRIFSAVFIECKKYQQIADELDISINTVKTLLKNGVKQMQRRFAGRENLFLFHLLFFF